MRKYIDLKCDFGFKYCMSDPIIMMSFLNAILDGDEDTITSVQFENVEDPRRSKNQRGVIFDLLCTTNKGDTILIEMQNSYQKFFKTRANFYTYNLLQKKIGRGDKWNKMKKDISKIIGIFIMCDGLAGLDKAITKTAECDLESGEMFWDRHRKYFISLPKFKLDEHNVTTKDIWINCFKNPEDMMDRISQSTYERADEGLKRLIDKARVAALTEEEYAYYDASMKALEDEIDMEELGIEIGIERGIERGMEIGMQKGLQKGLEKGLEKGMKKGLEKGLEEGAHNNSIQIATEMKKKGFDIDSIHELTKLSLEEIDSL